VNPNHPTLLLYQQFIEVFFVQVTDVEQYRRVAQRLFNTYTSYVHRASCQVVARWHTSHGFVDCWTSEPTVDYNLVIPFTI
jgi:hypothetical protein